jgi:hypothetical protein
MDHSGNAQRAKVGFEMHMVKAENFASAMAATPEHHFGSVLPVEHPITRSSPGPPTRRGSQRHRALQLPSSFFSISLTAPALRRATRW